MKLLTTIKPRTDGTVIVRDSKGRALTFVADEAGILVCDVEDQALVGSLLVTGDFEPADEADHQLAEGLVRAAAGSDEGDGDDDGEDDDFDGNPDAVPAGSLPVEAGTPPRATRKPRGKAN